jgi:site-specific recombinase XerD
LQPTRDRGTPDLFDQTPEDWVRDPRKAFDAWLVSQAFRRSSAEVYRAQWGHFIDWLELTRQPLLEVDEHAIITFLTGLEAKKQQRARYLRLIERVFDHLLAKRSAPNPARRAVLTRDATWPETDDNEPTGFLTRSERTRLIAQLETSLPSLTPGAYWREARDRALCAVFLGAGLKLGEAQALKLGALLDDAWILVEAEDPRFSRRTRLAPFARPVMAMWLRLREAAGIPGQLVFPSSSRGSRMHKATVLRGIDAQVEMAGIAESRQARASPQTMRNTFAASLFEAGESPELVAQWLGYSQLLSAQRLLASWKAWGSARPARRTGDA